MRIMYDDVNPDNILHLPGMHAGYVDGLYAWPKDKLAQCEVKIAVFASTNDGNCCDCERFDLTPEEVLPWILMRRAAGVWASCYAGQNSRDIIFNAFTTANKPLCPFWIADWTNKLHLVDGSVATQWTSGDKFDTSVVQNFWPGVDDNMTVNPMQLTDILTFSDGTVYTLRASGEVQASRIGFTIASDGKTVPQEPVFHTYTIKGDDGDFYTFGPGLNGGVFAYPGLPPAETLGSRQFFEIRAGAGRW